MGEKMNIIDIDKYYKLGESVKEFYHYTSAESLVNIIRDNKLRFTDCMFLNDKEEYSYFKKLICSMQENDSYSNEVKSVLKQMSEFLTDENEESFLTSEGSSLTFHRGQYFVFCGSLDKDSLPLWNYYVKSDNYTGYSLGINLDILLSSLRELNRDCFLGKVVYDKKTQEKIVLDFIDEAH